jgi:hypothetical protein
MAVHVSVCNAVSAPKPSTAYSIIPHWRLSLQVIEQFRISTLDHSKAYFNIVRTVHDAKFNLSHQPYML